MALRTAVGMALGTAVVPCTSGAYDLCRGDGSQLLALLGTGVGTFPLGTSPLLRVFWGSQDPPAPHGLPGGPGGGREEAETPRRDEERLEGGLSGAAAGGRQMGGRGPLVPVPPAHCGVSAQGPPSPQSREKTRAGDTTRTRHPRALALAGGLGGQAELPRALPEGRRGWDEGRWLHILFTSASGRRCVPKGASGSGSRGTKPRCQQAPASPRSQGSCQATPAPNKRHAAAGGARDRAGSQLGECPPRAGRRGEVPPWGQASSPAPCPRSLAVPAARRDARNQRAGNKVAALPGPSARTPGPAPAAPRPQRGDHGARLGGTGGPVAGAVGPPCSPLPQRVPSARWVCVTAASSSSPPLTRGTSAPAPSVARPGTLEDGR